MAYTVRLVFQRLVCRIAYSVQGVLRIRIESAEQRIEVDRRGAGCGDEFKGFAQGVIGGEAVDEDLGDLTLCNHAIAGIACLACVAL